MIEVCFDSRCMPELLLQQRDLRLKTAERRKHVRSTLSHRFGGLTR